ncbi:telomere-associated protein Tap [Streptomyces sp. NPDC087297]|uniref:telomere-associated protein Tap n=1 Tax=Streptomyces sp. NPDC087297 TaxID=3365778 RepID=UPI003801288C
MSDALQAAEALINRGPRPPGLPTPDERRRLREVWGATLEEFASALDRDVPDMEAWEAGQAATDPADDIAYARLLQRIREHLPATYEPDWAALRRTVHDTPSAKPDVLCDGCGQEIGACERCGLPTTSRPGGRWLHRGTTCTPSGPLTPGQSDPLMCPPLQLPPRRLDFPAGPVAVIDYRDGALFAHLSKDRTSDCPQTLAELLVWTHTEGLGAVRLHNRGHHQYPLLVLTGAATPVVGLPLTLNDPIGRLLPASHPALHALNTAGWHPVGRGMGPWSRLQARTAPRGRVTVHLAVQPWGALADAGWELDALTPEHLTRLLARYADTVIVPQGSTATCGSRLMTALRPPKQWTGDVATSKRILAPPVRGALTEAHAPAPPEAPPAHPVARGWDPVDVQCEEPFDWFRDPTAQELDDFDYVVGLDTNFAFTNAAGRVRVGYGPVSPTPENLPDFDASIPGCWYADLSHIATDPRLPSPFTPTGAPPTGPAWYATPTLAYAQRQLRATIKPIKAYLRRGSSGPYLEDWNARLRQAYSTVLHRLGIDPAATGQAFFHARDQALVLGDPLDWDLLRLIKATANGGIGKLAEGPTDLERDPYEPWPALRRVTWRPDIRAAIIAAARTELHRKMQLMAATTGRYPLAVLTDCVVYPAARPTPFDLLPPGDPASESTLRSFTFGARFGHVKLEGTASMAWAARATQAGLNPASWIKDPAAAFEEPTEEDPQPCDANLTTQPDPDTSWRLF